MDLEDTDLDGNIYEIFHYAIPSINLAVRTDRGKMAASSNIAISQVNKVILRQNDFIDLCFLSSYDTMR